MSELRDWNDLKYFLAVARGGGLSAAAASLHTSASTVSRHIDAMEERLGMRLFLRQQRGYLLTDRGSELFAHVAEVERAMQAVERQSGVHGEVSGTVKLALPESLANYLIAPRLHELHARHPRLQVELVVARHLADLSRREADLAFRIVNPQQRDHAPDYIAHKVGAMEFGLYTTPAALAKAGGDWKNLEVVTWDESWLKLPMVEWLAQLFPGRAPALRVNSMQTQYVAVRGGLGATFLPLFIGGADSVLARIEVGELKTGRELWLLYHRDLKGSQRVQVIREFVEAVCNGAC
ncbi:MAG TPA: LysR family transcriptional regulator [Moraxellaceae bacterium]